VYVFTAVKSQSASPESFQRDPQLDIRVLANQDQWATHLHPSLPAQEANVSGQSTLLLLEQAVMAGHQCVQQYSTLPLELCPQCNPGCSSYMASTS